LNIWTLIPLITCLAYIILFVLSLPSIKRQINKVFIFYLAVSAVWSFCAFMLHLNAFPEQILLWNEALTVALIWTLITYYHFIRAYTNKHAGTGVVLGYVFLVILAVLCFMGKIVQSAHVTDGVLFNNLGISIYFIGAASLTFIGAGFYLLVKKYRGSTDPADRNRTMYLLIGWSILILLSYSNLIPAVAGLPLDHIGSLINVLIIAYTISRFRLLDIKFVIRRGLAFALAIIPVAALYIVGLWITFRFYPGLPFYTLLLLSVSLAVLLALISLPLRPSIQVFVDRIFYRETYDHRQSLLSFTNKMGNILNLEQLAVEMLQTLSKAIRISQAVLLFEDPGSGFFNIRFIYPEAENKSDNEFQLRFDSPVVMWLEKESHPLTLRQIDSIPQFKALWEAEKESLRNSNLELFCPLKSHNKLVGILALSRKRSGRLYTQEDIELVMSVANQAGIVVENAQLYAQALTWSITDGLTKLFNHRYLHERLDEEIARGTRFGAAFSVIMIDIDFFKTYNDTYGHLAGDEILASVGQCIKNSIRTIDIAFRYGGEEFAVILPETMLEGAYVVAERIREKIEEKFHSGRASITASLGIASWPTDGVTKEQIISSADKALYAAKETGRNKTCAPSDVKKQGLVAVGAESETQRIAISMIFALAATVDAKDHYTYGHSRKVSQYAVNMAEAMNLPKEKISVIRNAGLLHDIGKIGIPDSILNKEGMLDEQEWRQIKAHPELGVEILRYVAELSNSLPIILNHHEHYDGSGYPSGLSGEKIPLEARLLSVADAYDAMTSLRPYHNQRSPQDAIDELRRCAGTNFDPELVEVFCKIIQPMVLRGKAEQ
jgi:diguanylate cyclase (GGDEF)-like protein/putative nucleotidyltransferase with HDIG domain